MVNKAVHRPEVGTTVQVDEHPRDDVTLESLARLSPVFREGGTVTAWLSLAINVTTTPSGGAVSDNVTRPSVLCPG